MEQLGKYGDIRGNDNLNTQKENRKILKFIGSINHTSIDSRNSMKLAELDIEVIF
jgi:hypothetical protein